MNAVGRNSLSRIGTVLFAAAVMGGNLWTTAKAKAQVQPQSQQLRVMVGDFVDERAHSAGSQLAIAAKKDMYNELVSVGSAKYSPVDPEELMAQAKSLTPALPTPSDPYGPYNYSLFDYTRLGEAVGASAVLSGRILVTSGGGGGKLVLEATLTNLIAQAPINGAQVEVNIAGEPGESATSQEAILKAVDDAALSAVTEMVSRQLLTATVLQISRGQVVLNKGTRDGFHDGEDVAILRELPGGRLAKVGLIRIVRAYADNSECEIRENAGGISPEDIGLVLYRPQYIYTLAGGKSINRVNTRINLSAIGSTLAALGLGVLLVAAAKGGQATTTNVVAEPTALNGAPQVRVTWGDNLFGQAGVLQYKVYRLPDFPPGAPGVASNTGTGGGGGTGTGGGGGTGTGGGGGTGGTGINFAAGIPVGAVPPSSHIFLDHASPFDSFATVGGFYSGFSGSTSSGNLGGGGGGGAGGGTSTGGGCAFIGISGFLDTGFTPGKSYQYEVTAVIARQQPIVSSGGGTGGTGGGIGGGTGGIGGGTGGIGGGTGGIGGGTGGIGGGTGTGGTGSNVLCIETDPVPSGYATPITPVTPTAPAAGASVDIRSFNPTWTSRVGADLFDVEVSTDRTFKNPKIIYTVQVFSTAPTQDGVAQTLPSPVDLTKAPQLLADPTFSAFVSGSGGSGSTPATPTLFYRIGARHDEDTPGPENWITQNASDINRTFRFVYSDPIQFSPTPLPPPPPGKKASLAAAALNAAGSRAAVLHPVMPRSVGIVPGVSHPVTPQQVLNGRARH